MRHDTAFSSRSESFPERAGTASDWLFLRERVDTPDVMEPKRPRDFRPHGRVAALARVTPADVRAFTFDSESWVGECAEERPRRKRSSAMTGWSHPRGYK